MALPLLLLALYLHPPTLTPPEVGPPLPPIADLDRFPSYDLCDQQLAFLAARRAWLDNLHGLFAAPMYQPYFDAATDDLEARRRPWAILYEAHGWVAREWSMDEMDERRNYPADSREKMARRKLAELRDLIGDRDYLAGILPAAVGPEFWRSAH